MTVLDVYLNDRKRCRAGVGADGVLTAIVNWVKLTGPAARRARRLRQPVEESHLHVGGLSHDIHRSWIDQRLTVGDRVTVVVAKAATADRARSRKPRMSKRPKMTETTFLNVDLDIESASPLDSLVRALGPSVFPLHVGPEGRRRHTAHIEAAVSSDDPDLLIRRFVALITRLPREKRQLWNRAHRREFNVGIQAAAAPRSFELRLAPSTIQAAASVNASVAVTVYAP